MNFSRFGAGFFAVRLVIFWMCHFGMVLFVVTAVGQATHVENGTTFDGPGGKMICYEVIGSSSKEILLVLVNGGPGLDHLHLHTSPAWDVLARSRRLIFYDQRGTGRSSPLKEGQSCTLADQIDDLDALRGHVGGREDHHSGQFLGRIFEYGIRRAPSRTCRRADSG